LVGHIKSIKMSGLAQKLHETISALRLDEMKSGTMFRLVAAITSAVAQIPVMISPVAAFGLFTIVSYRTGETLDATRLFAALSLILLLSQPLFWMFEVVLDMGAAMGCFERIEKYLSENERVDHRVKPDGSAQGSPIQPNMSTETDGIELQSLVHGGGRKERSGDMIKVENATFSWTVDGRSILVDISFSVKRSQLAMLIGPIASGKSTLLKGMLGEVPYVQGKVLLSADRLCWCEQSPWITVSNPPCPFSLSLM
jgi:ATP-binding cassette, subfamily C (CFTR/MRP), member 1